MILSDEFDGAALKPFWAERLGAAGNAVAVGADLLQMSVIIGPDFWTGQNDGIMVTQDAGLVDFDIETQIATFPSGVGRQQGFIVTDSPTNPQNYVLLSAYRGGGNRVFFGHATFGGASQVWFDADPGGSPLLYRLHRRGDDYTAERSSDGVTWIPIAGGTWAQPLGFVGLYAASWGSLTFPDADFHFFQNLNEQGAGLEWGANF